jgi:hypothetical protein
MNPTSSVYDIYEQAYIDERVVTADQPPEHLVFAPPAPDAAPMWFAGIGPGPPQETMTAR